MAIGTEAVHPGKPPVRGRKDFGSFSVDVQLIVDMQEDLLRGEAKHDLSGVVTRINQLAATVRRRGGQVIFIQHDGRGEGDFEPFTPGWEILDSIEQDPRDRIVRKHLNDAFLGTSLQADLELLGAERVLVSGWATDFCVDATVRSAAALGFKVVVAADCHTLSPRPHLSAEGVIEHHHWIWRRLISRYPVEIARASEIEMT